MQSFSFDRNPDDDLWLKVWGTIEANKRFFHKHWGSEADEAMQQTLLHTLDHYDESKGSLKTYVLSIGKDILRVPAREVQMDMEDEEAREALRATRGSLPDFSDGVVADAYIFMNARNEIEKFALSNMQMFILFCECIQSGEYIPHLFPKAFRRECKALLREFPNFFAVCADIYAANSGAMKKFIGEDIDTEGIWVEADMRVKQNIRVRLVGANGIEVSDADREAWTPIGLRVRERLFSVGYRALFERLRGMLYAGESNPIKFILGNNYVIRTLGGSVSIENANLRHMEEIIRSEIVTNIVNYTDGKIAAVGSERVYLACKGDSPSIPKQRIRGIDIELEVCQAW